MKRNVWTMALPLSAVLLLLGTSSAVQAGHLFPRPAVSYYHPAPAVSYYTPVVSYTPAYVSHYYTPAVSYHYTPSVSFYPTPAVAAPGSAVTTTQYGLFGRPKSTTTYYYQPVLIAP